VNARARLRVVAAIVFDGPLLLMTQRPPGDPLGLLWEFPGGKIEPGESPEEALVREIREELGVGARAGQCVSISRFDYDHGPRVEIHFIRATLEAGVFAPSTAVHAFRWVPPDAVRLDEVLEADREFLRGMGAKD
jgi:8-oxo-dGTP diphosphatase